MRFLTRDDITSFNQMVDLLAREGVCLDFDNREEWIEPPELLYEKLRKGELYFGPRPKLGPDLANLLPHTLSTWRTCARVRLLTKTMQFVELWREYNGVRVPQMAQDGDPAWKHMAYPGWTVSETGEPGETPVETALRGITQELGFNIQPSELKPLPLPYTKSSGLLKKYAFMHEDDPLHDTHPSTIFPLWSTVESHWFLWPVAEASDRIKGGVYLHDENVLICRDWQPL